MLKFFRSIRQKLLKQNKISNYLIYAIGEIVLVVIGILIALAINNKNQERALQEKEHIYLVGLQKEFLTSKNKLEVLLDVNKNNYLGAKKLIEYINDPSQMPSEKEFSKLLYNSLANDISYNPNYSLLNEMINSGSLKDISNTKLRVLLTNWIATLEDISKQENELANQREKVLNVFLEKKYNIKTVIHHVGLPKELTVVFNSTNKSNLDLLHSTAFENNLLLYMLTGYYTETNHYRPLLEGLNNILALLNKEINK